MLPRLFLNSISQLLNSLWISTYRCYMAAGWDIGAEPITAYGDLLDRIAEVALRCGQRARAEVASTHRRCLRQRYGI